MINLRMRRVKKITFCHFEAMLLDLRYMVLMRTKQNSRHDQPWDIWFGNNKVTDVDMIRICRGRIHIFILARFRRVNKIEVES